MAGDWIKIRGDLPEHPRVISIHQQLGISIDEVVGKLARLWIWANRHLRNAQASQGVTRVTPALRPSVTRTFIDEYLQQPGFSDALAAVGWLDTTQPGIVLPKFDEHNWTQPKYSQTPGAIRQRAYRDRKRNKHGDGVTSPVTSRVTSPVTSRALPTYTNTSLEENPLTPLEGESTSSEKNPAAETTPTGETKHPQEKNQNPKEDKKDQESKNISFRGMPCDNPELAVVAKRVVEHYRKTVKSPNPWGGAQIRIIALLHAGHTEEQLCRSASNYAKHCERNNTENRHRQGAAKFYSDSGEYEAFKDYQPEPEKPKNILRPPRPEKLRHEEIPPQIVGDLFDKKDQSKEG